MKRKYLLILPVLFLGFYAKSQDTGLFVQSNAQITVKSGATVNSHTQLTNSGTITIEPGATLASTENVNNEGVVANEGEVVLDKDLTNSSVATFNTTAGKLTFSGGNNQSIQIHGLSVKDITVSKDGGTATLVSDSPEDSLKITGTLVFEQGALGAGDNFKFIVTRGAQIDHAPDADSYFEGELISEGTGYREFPVGDGGYYGKIRFEEVFGSANTRFAVSMIHAPEHNPVPNEDVIGVSRQNVWQVQHEGGTLDSVLIGIEYIDEDLENFAYENEIRRRKDSPVLVVADSSISGPYRSLGVELLTDADPDSVQWGNLLSGEYAKFTNYGTNYFAIGLAPLKDDKGQIYFPNVFAPKAMDPDNQTYKVFGEQIAESPFRMEIYNRFSQLVYATDSYEEASTRGWDGTNKYGKEEYTGLYYVYVRYAFTSDPTEIKEYKGPIMLKR